MAYLKQKINTISTFREFLLIFFCCSLYKKNNFVEMSKNLARYRSKNNFAGIKIIMQDAQKVLTFYQSV